MKPDRLFLHRFVLVLILLLGLTATLPASSPSPQQQTGPVFAEWLEGISVGRPTNRSTVIRIAALGMGLALFIMYYKKH